MRTITFLCILIASANMITIKISKADGKIYKPPAESKTTLFKPNRNCNDLVPDVKVADLFNVYSRQIYNILNDDINELILAKHEFQVIPDEGVLHRSIFRVEDTETDDKLFYGFKTFIDSKGGVRVIAYLESFNVKEIFTAFNWDITNDKDTLYTYPCDNVQKNAVLAFDNWGKELNVCVSGQGNNDAAAIKKQNDIKLQNEQIAIQNEQNRIANEQLATQNEQNRIANEQHAKAVANKHAVNEQNRIANENKAKAVTNNHAVNEAAKIDNMNEAKRLNDLNNKYMMEEAARQEEIRKNQVAKEQAEAQLKALQLAQEQADKTAMQLAQEQADAQAAAMQKAKFDAKNTYVMQKAAAMQKARYEAAKKAAEVKAMADYQLHLKEKEAGNASEIEDNDSPFHTVQFNVHTKDANGNPIMIGSAAPKKGPMKPIPAFTFEKIEPIKKSRRGSFGLSRLGGLGRSFGRRY